MLHYKNLLQLSTETEISENTPIDFRDTLIYLSNCVLFSEEKREIPEDKNLELLEKKIAHLESLSSSRELTPLEIEQKTRLYEIVNSYKGYLTNYKNGGPQQMMLETFNTLIRFINHLFSPDVNYAEISRLSTLSPMLTLSKKTKELSMFSKYPPSPFYTGVYFDSKRMLFNFSPLERGKFADEAMLTLEFATEKIFSHLEKIQHAFRFGELLEEMEDNFESRIPEGFYPFPEELANFVKDLKSSGNLYIAVTEGLVTNSLLIDDVIMFDKDFIEFIMDSMDTDYEDAALYILSERLIHELGHVVLRKKGLDRIDQEIKLIELAIYFHKNVLMKNERLFAQVQSFTHRKIERIRRSPQKFSEYFNSSCFKITTTSVVLSDLIF